MYSISHVAEVKIYLLTYLVTYYNQTLLFMLWPETIALIMMDICIFNEILLILHFMNVPGQGIWNVS